MYEIIPWIIHSLFTIKNYYDESSRSHEFSAYYQLQIITMFASLLTLFLGALDLIKAIRRKRKSRNFFLSLAFALVRVK